ncbi:MAG: glycosyltransferase family 39 protein [Planctomycetes bacterium]|nr:glycosyltransferase family 39 protein [Planctomycetota bacterium]MCG2684811.1 glycosyltransferase family 39 protein [Planctomycetales bacterium]
MGNSLLSIFIFAAIVVAAFGLGRPLWRLLGTNDDDRLTTTAFSLGIGLTAAGCVLLALGLLGMFRPLPIVVLTMVGCCWGLVEIGNESLRLKTRVPSLDAVQDLPERPWPEPNRLLPAVVLTAAAAGCASSLLGALAPPTAEAALAGPLDLAKRFCVEHRIVEPPSGMYASPSLPVALWYVWASTLDGGVCAQLIDWGLGLLLTLATVVLASPLLGRRWAWIAGAMVVLTPALNQQMSLPTQYVALAALATLALAAWWRAVAHGGDGRWFVAAGLTAGGAVGVHPTAALLALPLGAAWVWTVIRRKEQRHFLLRGGAATMLISVAVGGALLTFPSGNRQGWQGQQGWHAPERSEGRVSTSDHALRCAQGRAAKNAFSDHLGLVLLAAAPGVLIVRRLLGLWEVAFVAVAFAALVMSIDGDARLLFPAVPLLSVAAVWVWIELRRFPAGARRAAVAALALMLAVGAAKSLVRSSDVLRVSLGMEDRESYLVRREPTYTAAVAANHLLRPDARLLSQDRCTFYFDCRTTWTGADERLLELERSSMPVGEVSKRLREAGYTHLLLAEPIGKNGRRDSPLSRLADASSVLTDYQRRDADGRAHRYRLVPLR